MTTGVHECAACELASSEAQIVDIERKVVAGVPARQEVFGPRIDGLNYVQPGTSKWLSTPLPISYEEAAQIQQIKILPEKPDGHGLLPGEVTKVGMNSAPHQVQVRADLKAPGLLVLRTTWLPGWSVRVDGSPWHKPLCANRWMLCTPVAAGTHNVEFRYRPVALYVSIAVCALAWLAMFGSLLASYRRAILHPADIQTAP
jgi:hypothetical protein